MQSMQGQSTSQESDVRQAIVNALMPRAEQTKVVQDQPGTLIVDVGSVGKAFLMGGFRNAMKMPMRITVNTQGGPGGTGITIHVGSHGTGGGYMSGGWLGVVKQRKAEKAWMDIVLQSIPGVIGAPSMGTEPQQLPEAPQGAMPPGATPPPAMPPAAPPGQLPPAP